MKFTSLIPPNFPIPDPPESRMIGAVISALVSLVLIGLILFVCVEFFLDQAGHPLRSDGPTPPQDIEERIPTKKIFTAEEMHKQFRVISPADRMLLDQNTVAVLCRWRKSDAGTGEPPVSPNLWVDELPVPWTVQFGTDVWFARLKLDEGVHRVRTLDKEFDVCVGKPKPERSPSARGEWRRFKIHEGTDDPTRCVECHAIIDGKNDVVRKGRGLTVGSIRNESCYVCHEYVSVAVKHATIEPEPGNDCASCHGLHLTADKSAPGPGR